MNREGEDGKMDWIARLIGRAPGRSPSREMMIEGRFAGLAAAARMPEPPAFGLFRKSR